MGSSGTDVLKMLVDSKIAETPAETEGNQFANPMPRHSLSTIRRYARSGGIGRAGSTVWWPPWQSWGPGASRIRVGLSYVVQWAVLWAISVAGTVVASAFSLPLPGNLVGMLLLLSLLSLGVVQPARIQEGAGLLLRHLPFFFIPLNVGVIAWGGLFASSGVALAVSLVGGALVGLIASGLIAQWTASRGGRDVA